MWYTFIDMEGARLFQEFSSEISGEMYITGIIYHDTNPHQYLLVKHLRTPEQFTNSVGNELWTIPGGHLTDRDVVRLPILRESARILHAVEKVIQSHITLTLGIEVDSLEFLLDPTIRMIDDIPVMSFYARHVHGRVDERLGYLHTWATYDVAAEADVDPISLQEIKTLDNIFRERAMYDEVEREIDRIGELVESMKHFSEIDTSTNST